MSQLDKHIQSKYQTQVLRLQAQAPSHLHTKTDAIHQFHEGASPRDPHQGRAEHMRSGFGALHVWLQSRATLCQRRLSTCLLVEDVSA
mmetsp:Transcript_8880/g.23942  ORF Transcript_8880/g.23942 Transcript_8880/m.23942 type:complete len:88 (+) Transcript_8880:365-628(+)